MNGFANFGGAIYAGSDDLTMTINRSLFSNNQADNGGAIYIEAI